MIMTPKIICRMTGRNPDNPKSRQAGLPTAQRLEVKEGGLCNTITTVQKDNLVLMEKQDMNIKRLGNIYNENAGTGFAGNVWDKDGLCPTLTTMQGGGREPFLVDETIDEDKYKIRKLTPRESWRLMGFTDEDFEKAEKVNSNTQLYKQAGNSIVKQVLMAIFTKLGA